MTSRKKNILLIQILILIAAILLIYITYIGNDKSTKITKKSDIIKEDKDEKIDLPDSNTFEDVEYNGVDLNGNRYEIRSKMADFKVETPEIINMKIMSAVFYFKDGTVLKVDGDYGTYNNKTNDMKFRENIKAEYQNDRLFADNLDYLNTKNLLTIYGNVKTESIKGNIMADNLKFDLSEQTLNISMFSEKQINMKLKN